MKRNFNKSKSKKAFLALESLLGIIISVVALFFIFQTFFNVFFQTPTNLKIAEDNARSIVEFIDYSNKKYANSNDCYTLLSLKNLENYQFKDNDNKNYFYFINNIGVNIYLKKDFDLAINNFDDLKNLKPIKTLKFKNKIKLNKEKLDVNKINFDWTISIFDTVNLGGILDWGVGTLKTYKNFYHQVELENSQGILIYTAFGTTIFGVDSSNYLDTHISILNIDPLNNNQNILYAINYERLNSYDKLDSSSKKIIISRYFNSHYLAYSPNNKVFPIFTLDSENYMKKNLCGFDNIENQIQNSQFSNKEDYFNQINKNKIIIIKGKNNNEYKFKFEKNKKTCYKNSNKINCEEIFNKNINNLNYNKFVKEIQNLPLEFKIGDATSILEDKNKEEFYKNLYIPQKEKITLDIIENSFSDKYSNYDIYIIKRNSITNSIQNIFNFNVINENNNNYFNNCKGDLCNFILFDKTNQKVYLYDDKYYKNFVRFNIKYLEREKNRDLNIIYFNGHQTFSSISAEFANNDNLGSRGLFNPIRIRGYMGNGDIEFLLSNLDVSKIPKLNYNKK